MSRYLSRSIEVKCMADQAMSDGVTNCFLVTNPDDPKTEWIMSALRKFRISFDQGDWYRITVQKIDRPS
jgi:hypothetical protein